MSCRLTWAQDYVAYAQTPGALAGLGSAFVADDPLRAVDLVGSAIPDRFFVTLDRFDRHAGPDIRTGYAPPMRVLIVSRTIPAHPIAGGMETVAWELARGLGRTDHVEMVTTPVPGYPPNFELDGVRVRTLRGARPGRYSFRWWIGSALTDLANIDVVLSVSAGATAMIWMRPGPQYVFQAHGTAARVMGAVVRARDGKWPLKAVRLAYWTLVDRITYKLSGAVVSVGPAVTAALSAKVYRGSFRQSPPIEIPNGVPPWADNAGADVGRDHQGRAQVLFVGRLTRQKGVDRVIAAMPIVDAQLVVLGDGDELTSLRSQALELGVADDVAFLGRQEREGVQKALARSDVFVFVPRGIDREGLPISVLEAVSLRRPVVTVSPDNWPEDLRDQFVYVSDPDDPAQIAAAIYEARERPTSLPARYTSAHSVSQYRALMKALLEESARGKRWWRT